jgi:peroxiredoxin
LAGFAKSRRDFESAGATIVAVSVDALDKAQEVAREVKFPIGYGVTREMADLVGAWWDPGRSIVQPAEFIVGSDGKVLSSTYSSGPIGRVEPADALKLIRLYASRKGKG